MLKATAIALFLLVLPVVALAQAPPSQPPSPSGLPHSGAVEQPPQARQQQSAPDERGTNKAPLIVKMQNAPKSQAEAEQDADYQQRKAADERNSKLGIWAIGVGIAQTLALVATFLVVAFVGVRQLRAYIYPAVELKTFSLVGPVEFCATFKNAGVTPARHFECHTVAFLAALPLGDDAKIEKPMEDESINRHSKASIFPGLERSADFVLIDPLTPKVIQALKTKRPNIAIYAAGEARYRDMFYRKRRTEFCVYINPEDTVALIESEEGARKPPDILRYVSSHVCNIFT